MTTTADHGQGRDEMTAVAVLSVGYLCVILCLPCVILLGDRTTTANDNNSNMSQSKMAARAHDNKSKLATANENNINMTAQATCQQQQNDKTSNTMIKRR